MSDDVKRTCFYLPEEWLDYLRVESARRRLAGESCRYADILTDGLARLSAAGAPPGPPPSRPRCLPRRAMPLPRHVWRFLVAESLERRRTGSSRSASYSAIALDALRLLRGTGDLKPEAPTA